MHRAVFLDKDGTLIPDIPFNVNPDLISLQGCCVEGLRALRDAGYLLILITNQSGVALGLFDEESLHAVEAKITRLLFEQGIALDGFYYCPHHEEGTIRRYRRTCDCRKPEPGLLLQAAADFRIDLNQSWMIGDILNDIEAGNRAGCKSILIHNGNETEWIMTSMRHPSLMVKNINEAASYIMLNHRVNYHEEKLG